MDALFTVAVLSLGVSVVPSETDLLGSERESIIPLFRACIGSRLVANETGQQKRSLVQLVSHLRSRAGYLDMTDQYYTRRADRLYEELCGDLEVFYADLAAHTAKSNRYHDLDNTGIRIPAALRPIRHILQVCIRQERAQGEEYVNTNYWGEGRRRRNLGAVLGGLRAHSNGRGGDAVANIITERVRALCSEVKSIIQALTVPNTITTSRI